MNKKKTEEFVKGLCETFIYVPDDGALLWKHNHGRAKRGKVAGWVNCIKYRVVQFRRNTYLAHRLIWMIETGKYPKGLVHHKDGDCTNNRFSNLELMTSKQHQAQHLGGRKRPLEVGRKISKAKKGNVVISEKQKRQISKALQGNQCAKRTPCTDGVTTWPSIADAARELGVTNKYVFYRLNRPSFSSWKRTA